MNLTRKLLELTPSIHICQYELSNSHHMKAIILSYGASLWKLLLPFPDGNTRNVILSYADPADYLKTPLYAGAILAPTAGRISNASFSIQRNTFRLSRNDHQHNIHGGLHSGTFQNWKETNAELHEHCCSITLQLTLADGLDGFPGNRMISVTYTLTDDNELQLSFHASTDRLTYLNLSSHPYFNLSGNLEQSGLKQCLQIDSDQHVENSAEHIPFSTAPNAASPFDFHSSKSLEDNMRLFENDPQLHTANGYNHAFLLHPHRHSSSPAVTLSDPVSGNRMELYTDAPAVVLYSGSYIPSDLLLDQGIYSSPSCAIALEAQDIPDAPFFSPDSCHFLVPGENYQRSIYFHFHTDLLS